MFFFCCRIGDAQTSASDFVRFRVNEIELKKKVHSCSPCTLGVLHTEHNTAQHVYDVSKKFFLQLYIVAVS